jgi:hypothetical protein
MGAVALQRLAANVIAAAAPFESDPRGLMAHPRCVVSMVFSTILASAG